MKSEAAGIETLPEPGRDERNSPGSSEVSGAGPFRFPGGNLSSGLRRNWVTPWLTMSHSTVCPYLCVMGTC